MGEKVYKYLKRLNLWKDDEMFSMYDEIEEAKDNGTLEKGFVRCRGKYLKELYDAMQEPNCSYETSINDLIKSTPYEDFQSFPVPVVIKGVRNGTQDHMGAELVCSRLANIFGVKTAFYAPVDDGAGYIMSVDFLKVLENHSKNSKDIKAQTIETFNDITNSRVVHSQTPVGTWLHMLDREFLEDDRFKNLSQERKSAIKKCLIQQILFRRYILEDNDLHGDNVAFTHCGDYSDMEVSPMFDFEYALGNEFFFGGMSAMQRNDIRTFDMQFLLREYPEETISILKGFEITEEKEPRIQQVISKYITDESQREYWIHHIHDNVGRLLAERDECLADMSILEGGDSYEI